MAMCCTHTTGRSILFQGNAHVQRSLTGQCLQAHKIPHEPGKRDVIHVSCWQLEQQSNDNHGQRLKYKAASLCFTLKPFKQLRWNQLTKMLHPK